jgi:hypothetical protein
MHREGSHLQAACEIPPSCRTAGSRPPADRQIDESEFKCPVSWLVQSRLGSTGDDERQGRVEAREVRSCRVMLPANEIVRRLRHADMVVRMSGVLLPRAAPTGWQHRLEITSMTFIFKLGAAARHPDMQGKHVLTTPGKGRKKLLRWRSSWRPIEHPRVARNDRAMMPSPASRRPRPDRRGCLPRSAGPPWRDCGR